MRFSEFGEFFEEVFDGLLRTVGVAPFDKRGRFEAAFSVRSGPVPERHRRKELLALIRAHQPVIAVDEDATPSPPGTENSIVAALRSRLITKDTQIAELKSQLRQRGQTIAVLHGELEKPSCSITTNTPMTIKCDNRQGASRHIRVALLAAVADS